MNTTKSPAIICPSSPEEGEVFDSADVATEVGSLAAIPRPSSAAPKRPPTTVRNSSTVAGRNGNRKRNFASEQSSKAMKQKRRNAQPRIASQKPEAQNVSCSRLTMSAEYLSAQRQLANCSANPAALFVEESAFGYSVDQMESCVQQTKGKSTGQVQTEQAARKSMRTEGSGTTCSWNGHTNVQTSVHENTSSSGKKKSRVDSPVLESPGSVVSLQKGLHGGAAETYFPSPARKLFRSCGSDEKAALETLESFASLTHSGLQLGTVTASNENLSTQDRKSGRRKRRKQERKNRNQDEMELAACTESSESLEVLLQLLLENEQQQAKVDSSADAGRAHRIQILEELLTVRHATKEKKAKQQLLLQMLCGADGEVVPDVTGVSKAPACQEGSVRTAASLEDLLRWFNNEVPEPEVRGHTANKSCFTETNDTARPHSDAFFAQSDTSQNNVDTAAAKQPACAEIVTPPLNSHPQEPSRAAQPSVFEKFAPAESTMTKLESVEETKTTSTDTTSAGALTEARVTVDLSSVLSKMSPSKVSNLTPELWQIVWAHGGTVTLENASKILCSIDPENPLKNFVDTALAAKYGCTQHTDVTSAASSRESSQPDRNKGIDVSCPLPARCNEVSRADVAVSPQNGGISNTPNLQLPAVPKTSMGHQSEEPSRKSSCGSNKLGSPEIHEQRSHCGRNLNIHAEANVLSSGRQPSLGHGYSNTSVSSDRSNTSHFHAMSLRNASEVPVRQDHSKSSRRPSSSKGSVHSRWSKLSPRRSFSKESIHSSWSKSSSRRSRSRSRTSWRSGWCRLSRRHRSSSRLSPRRSSSVLSQHRNNTASHLRKRMPKMSRRCGSRKHPNWRKESVRSKTVGQKFAYKKHGIRGHNQSLNPSSVSAHLRPERRERRRPQTGQRSIPTSSRDHLLTRRKQVMAYDHRDDRSVFSGSFDIQRQRLESDDALWQGSSSGRWSPRSPPLSLCSGVLSNPCDRAVQRNGRYPKSDFRPPSYQIDGVQGGFCQSNVEAGGPFVAKNLIYESLRVPLLSIPFQKPI